MGVLDDRGAVNSPSVLLLGRLWWWHWGGDYVLQWQLLANRPNCPVAPSSGVEGILLPIDSSSPLTHPSEGERQSKCFVESPAFKPDPLQSKR